MRNSIRTLIVSAAALAALSLAPAANAGHDNDAAGCNQPVRTLAVKTNVLRPARPFDRGSAVYVVSGDVVRRWFNLDSSTYYWDWVYAETNHIPGLQREDSDCDSRAREPDTVLFSSELLCTCAYPFGGYPPLSWLTGGDPVPRP